MAFVQEVIPAKRPLEDAFDVSCLPPHKRPALQDRTGTEHPSTNGFNSAASSNVSKESLAKASEIIRREFGTEILLKHNELRLIDTEIAKCQAALEQIRRARLIPYPSQTGRSQDMLSVSTGSGPALVPAGMPYPPTHPAPWGVTDGPYSRHYAGWLISAPEFEGGLPASRLQASRAAGAERRSRGQFDDPLLTSSRSRAQRGSTNARLQALPLGYPQPKGSRGPLTLKRQSDNKWVKLVCQNCQREDFSSVQGFINHCRISHQVHFVTHEDAAQRAGTVEGVDQDSGEVSGSYPVIHSRTAHAPIGPTSTVTTNASNAGSNDLVHRYNRHGTDPRSLFPPRTEDPPSAPSSFRAQRLQRGNGAKTERVVNSNFTPSLATPHLSSLFAKSGRAGDLDALVRDATTKEDMEALVSPTTPDGVEHPSPVITPRHAHMGYQPQGGLSAPASGRKGPGRKAAPSNVRSLFSGSQADSQSTSGLKSISPPENSPTGAMDTIQAPSLVSDDGQSGSEGEGEEEEYRNGHNQQNEHRAVISSFDEDGDLLPEGPSTMEVEEKIRNWKHRGDPRPPTKRQEPQVGV